MSRAQNNRDVSLLVAHVSLIGVNHGAACRRNPLDLRRRRYHCVSLIAHDVRSPRGRSYGTTRRAIRGWEGKKNGSGGIRTHASEETGALNQRLRPLGHATVDERSICFSAVLTWNILGEIRARLVLDSVRRDCGKMENEGECERETDLLNQNRYSWIYIVSKKSVIYITYSDSIFVCEAVSRL